MRKRSLDSSQARGIKMHWVRRVLPGGVNGQVTWREDVSRTWVGIVGPRGRTGDASRFPEWTGSKRNASLVESYRTELWCPLPSRVTEPRKLP